MRGAEFKQWRQARALTQEALARRLGVGVRTVQTWEGSEAIRLGAVVKLALERLEMLGRPANVSVTGVERCDWSE
jgi:DNA-binding transcriptional regulator YiaG